jgi:serine/threonine protein kinase
MELTLGTVEGRVIDDFEILEQFAGGGFSHVHLARHIPTSTYCAAKVIDLEQNTDVFTMIMHEVSVFMQVRHVHLCPLYHLSQVDSLLLFFMEYEPHGTLSEYIRRFDAGLPESEARRLFTQVFAALRHCHVIHFLAHRDLKPENILLDAHMDARLIDFGLSDTFYCHTMRSVVGTAGHVAPEVIAGNDYDDRCDVWSLGVCLFRMATGRPPFTLQRVNPREIVKEAEQLVIPEILSRPLADILRRMLEPLPANRPTLTQLQCHPWLESLQPIAANVAPRPIVFYKVARFRDILRFHRAPTALDPEVIQRCLKFCQCDEPTLRKKLEEGRLCSVVAAYFIMQNPLTERPRSKLPQLQIQESPRIVVTPARPRGTTRLRRISSKPPVFASNPNIANRTRLPPIRLQKMTSCPGFEISNKP